MNKPGCCCILASDDVVKLVHAFWHALLRGAAMSLLLGAR